MFSYSHQHFPHSVLFSAPAPRRPATPLAPPGRYDSAAAAAPLQRATRQSGANAEHPGLGGRS